MQATKGLYELLFKKVPSMYSEDDLLAYKELLLLTGAHLNKKHKLKISRSHKYTNVIAPLFTQHQGFGLVPEHALNRETGAAVDYVHWDNINELVERLYTLHASKMSGNNNHDNEIQSIVEELREANIIY